MQKISLFWADRLRNIATVMVVAMHVAAPIAFEQPNLNGSTWWVGNLWNSVARPGVPLFVMLSGFLLLGKDYPLYDFLKRRFSRVLIPALAWMVFYSVYNYMSNGSPNTMAAAAVNITERNVHYHLWFIYMILGLYLIYPVLRPWIKTAHDRDFIYVLAMSAFCTWGYKMLYVFGGINIGIYFELFTNNCGYFILGYYLGLKLGFDPKNTHISPWKWSKSKLRNLGLAFVIIGTLITAFASYCLNTWYKTEQFQVFYYDYLTPNVSMAAIGWFLLAMTALNNKPLLKVESDFAAASFGVYFIHPWVMDWWGGIGYWHSMQHPYHTIPILVALICLISFLLISLIRCIPWGTKLT